MLRSLLQSAYARHVSHMTIVATAVLLFAGVGLLVVLCVRPCRRRRGAAAAYDSVIIDGLPKNHGAVVVTAGTGGRGDASRKGLPT